MSRALACTFGELHELRCEHRARLSGGGVVGSWVGSRRRGGRWRKEPVVVVAVQRKGEVGPDERLPAHLPVGNRSVGVDVVEVQAAELQCAPGDRIVGGGSPGTLGCIGRFAGAPAALTAGHVAGYQGAFWSCGVPPVRKVVAHAPYLVGTHVHDLGVLEAAPGPSKAVVLPSGVATGGPPVSPTELAGQVPGLLEVWAQGATTGWRRGVVAGLFAELVPQAIAPHVFDGGQMQPYTTDLVIHAGRGASAKGDSGKLWYTAQGRPLGLHWGGTVQYAPAGSTSRWAFATHAHRAAALGFAFPT